MEALSKQLQYLKGVGPRRSSQLQRLGIFSVFDLLWYVPRSYFDRRKTQPVALLEPGQNVSTRGTVASTSLTRTRRGMNIFQALIQDDSGVIPAVWFNQPFLANSIKKGQEIYIAGRVNNTYKTMQILVQEYDVIDNEANSFPIVPVYALTEGITQRMLRSLVSSILKEYLDYYPELLTDELQTRHGLCSIQTAFRSMHFPEGRDAYRQARKRLACEELLLFQLGLKYGGGSNQMPQNGIVHQEKDDLAGRLRDALPYRLTSAQNKVVAEIYADMEQSRPMNRMLQGDVGAGKTVVAALAMIKAVSSGYQTALMAPTEILAQQHFQNLQNLLKEQPVQIALLTGAVTGSDRKRVLGAVKTGQINILVGTHALIQQDVDFAALGLAVIDEQHRFGVKQRAILGNKGTTPDVLVMTATPIPRTLALTVYGDLDLSVIDQLPPSRKPVKTVYIKMPQRHQVYRYVQKELAQGSQAYVVCPLVEESEKQDLQAAVTLYEELRMDMLSEYKVGLLHGRMKSAEKQQLMQRFQAGDIQVMVSTTVIEVGVDVANATIMVVEQAERFGLSQLHQLRGRVGRGKQQSFCFLIGDPHTEDAAKRLQLMTQIQDGFRLAQEDLLLRGPGEFWGVKQHGLNQLRVADLVRDQELVQMSIAMAKSLGAAHFLRHAKYFDMKFKQETAIAAN